MPDQLVPGGQKRIATIGHMDPGDRTLLPQPIILLGQLQAMIGKRERIRWDLLLVGFIGGCQLFIAHLCSLISTLFQPKAGSVVLLVHAFSGTDSIQADDHIS